MADPAPRQRTASEVADHASDVVRDTQEWIEAAREARAVVDGASHAATIELAALVQRLAAQFEDLAAAVTRPRSGQAYGLGFMDGFEQPGELTVGRTWEDDDDANEQYDQGVDAGQAVGALLDRVVEAEDDLAEEDIVALIGAAYCLDESWGLAPIVGRKAQGVDCTEEESALILGAFDRLHTIGAPADASRDMLASLFPLEFDQWCNEHDQGARPGPEPSRRGPTLTVGEFLKLFDGVNPDTPVTVQHNDWWLNVSGLHVPPFMPTTCLACGHEVIHENGCWQDADGYACSAVQAGDDRHKPADVQREEPSVQIETTNDFDTRQW